MCKRLFTYKEVIGKLKVQLLTNTEPMLGDKLEVCFVDTMGNGEVIVMAKKVVSNG